MCLFALKQLLVRFNNDPYEQETDCDVCGSEWDESQIDDDW
jgi:hypothetical protein